MVDLDSNPTKLLEVVEVGKQLLMTRGSLTTFSIANDVAKYFAIIPAMFMTTYPALVTGIAQLLFPSAANGSLVRDVSGAPIGSELIAQRFARAEYFQPRPSAAGSGYDPLNSGGSNLGPTSKKLRDRGAAEVERLRKENPDAPGLIPAELVTASGSGLDPDLSPQGALWQAPRIAKARGVAREIGRAHV